MKNATLALLAAAALLASTGCKEDSDSKKKESAAAETGESAGAKADDTRKAANKDGDGEASRPPAEREELPEDEGEHRGAHAWSLRLGGADADAGRSLAVDDEGGLTAAGYIKGEVELAGKTRQAEGSDAYVARFSPEGELRWARSFGGKGQDVAEGVAVDGDGNAIVAGAFGEVLGMGDAEVKSAGADDGFIAKFSPEGKRLWAKRFGGRDVDAFHQVAATPEGDLLVTGVFRETVEFGDTTLEAAGDADVFLARLDPEGEVLWARGWGKIGEDFGRDVALDSQGDILLLVEFTLGVDFGGGPLESAGNRDIGLIKLTGDGEHVWSKSFGNELDSLAIDLAVDPADHVLVTGAFDDVHSFGGEEFRAAGRSDAFIAKYAPDGTHLWSTAFGSEDEDIGAAVATDRYGNVYATGWFWDEVDFPGGELKSAGKRDVYLLKLSPDGDPLWSKRFGAKQSDFGRGLAVTDDQGVALLGTFYFSASFGGDELTAKQDEDAPMPKADVFLARFSR